jgi:hypothetical protein
MEPASFYAVDVDVDVDNTEYPVDPVVDQTKNSC